MSLEQRAKIFVPFDPLEGFAAALRAVEEQAELERETGLLHPTNPEGRVPAGSQGRAPLVGVEVFDD